MAGSSTGDIFRVTTWGESAGPALGAVIDGVPAGLELNTEDIELYLGRRRPGATAFSSTRFEKDAVEIKSGVYKGITTGCPVMLEILNSAPAERKEISVYRPGHAEFSYAEKYGHYDSRSGGRASGRETAARVAAGAVAVKILKELGIEFCTYVKQIGDIEADCSRFDRDFLNRSRLNMPDEEAEKRALSYLKTLSDEGDSAGGIIEMRVSGLRAGTGEPVFNKLDARLAAAVMSVGAVKGVEIGEGFKAALLRGSENNDTYRLSDGRVLLNSNHAGGVLGGISNGGELLLRAAVKPTPSIKKAQLTVDINNRECSFSSENANDTVIVPRAVVVVEAMAAISITDLIFTGMSSKMENIKRLFLK